MRKAAGIFFIILMALLSSCNREETQVSARPEWDVNWYQAGDYLAVECPPGFELDESNDFLSTVGLFFSTWAKGEPVQIENDEGKEAIAYDTQIYMLVKVCDNLGASTATVDSWIEREKQSYQVETPYVINLNEKKYDVIPLVRGKDSNPYKTGVAAFTAMDDLAVSIEILSRTENLASTEEILSGFLSGIHY